jgi:3-methyladenine DNA glycosylase/8-oxoguanine DNA glycosylase
VKERIEVHPVLKPLLFQPLNSLARFVAKSASNRSMYARIIAGVLDTYQGQLQRHEFGQQE